jgi:hypothetical protein
MHSGSCLCGAIKYSVSGELGQLAFCHCSKCQKVNGTAFLAGASVEPGDFTLSDPQDYLASFESSPGVFRKFCKNCGSPLYSYRPGPPEAIRIRVGTLDTAYAGPVQMHIYYKDHAAWFTANDDVPKHEARP